MAVGCSVSQGGLFWNYILSGCGINNLGVGLLHRVTRNYKGAVRSQAR